MCRDRKSEPTPLSPRTGLSQIGTIDKTKTVGPCRYLILEYAGSIIPVIAMMVLYQLVIVKGGRMQWGVSSGISNPEVLVGGMGLLCRESI